MNFFDLLLIAIPVFIGLLKAVRDLNRDYRYDTKLRTYFYWAELGEYWDDAYGGGDERDVWHRTDLGIIFLGFANLGAFYLSGFHGWIDGLPLTVAFLLLFVYAVASLYALYCVFVLFYHHIFAPEQFRYPYSNFFAFMRNPFRDNYLPEVDDVV